MDAQRVVDKMAGEIAQLQVRLAVAEARAETAEAELAEVTDDDA